MSRITAGIFDAADDIIQEYDGAQAFQEAILTSDTCTKSCSAKISASIGEITVGGVVKGGGNDRAKYGNYACFPYYGYKCHQFGIANIHRLLMRWNNADPSTALPLMAI